MTIVHSVTQISADTKSFMKFHGHLVMTFGGCNGPGKTNIHMAAEEVSSQQIKKIKRRLSRTSQQWQNKIEQQATKISSLEAQNQKVSLLLDLKIFGRAIS